jgi:hypothetical protein
MSSNPSKKILTLIVGFVILIIGITLILAWWPSVMILVKGGIGMALALAGLFTLYTIKDLK